MHTFRLNRACASHAQSVLVRDVHLLASKVLASKIDKPAVWGSLFIWTVGSGPSGKAAADGKPYGMRVSWSDEVRTHAYRVIGNAARSLILANGERLQLAVDLQSLRASTDPMLGESPAIKDGIAKLREKCPEPHPVDWPQWPERAHQLEA